MLHTGLLVDDLMGNLVADSVGRAYSGKLKGQPRWGPIKQSVPQVQEENGEGEEEEEHHQGSTDEKDNGKDKSNGKQ